MPGSGFALSIAQDILRAHGGRLMVESDPAAGVKHGTGAGSTVALWLWAGRWRSDQPPVRPSALMRDELANRPQLSSQTTPMDQTAQSGSGLLTVRS